jgi:hypothetical protein
MMLHKLRIALAATMLALAAMSAVDSASAQSSLTGYDVHISPYYDAYVESGLFP